MSSDREKQLAAEAAAELVADGMRVGLGTGSTVAYLLPALARRGLSLRCVATSLATEEAARGLGLAVESFSGAGALAQLDIAIDGADQVAPSGWVVKGGGAAHTREKAVAAAAARFVVIVSSDKLVERLRAAGAARAPRVRPRGDARAHRLRRAPRRAEEPRRRRHRRLHGAGRRSGGARGTTVRDDRASSSTGSSRPTSSRTSSSVAEARSTIAAFASRARGGALQSSTQRRKPPRNASSLCPSRQFGGSSLTLRAFPPPSTT